MRISGFIQSCARSPKALFMGVGIDLVWVLSLIGFSLISPLFRSSSSDSLVFTAQLLILVLVYFSILVCWYAFLKFTLLKNFISRTSWSRLPAFMGLNACLAMGVGAILFLYFLVIGSVPSSLAKPIIFLSTIPLLILFLALPVIQSYALKHQNAVAKTVSLIFSKQFYTQLAGPVVFFMTLLVLVMFALEWVFALWSVHYPVDWVGALGGYAVLWYVRLTSIEVARV